MRIFAAIVGALLSLNVFADPAPSSPASGYLEGKDYILLEEPVRPADPSKIEVAEVFAYTCPHCFHFEPLLEAWMKNQKSDVVLVQTHTKWSESMEPYQRGFYTLVALKAQYKLQMPVFNAVHVEHKELNNAQAWADFAAGYGIKKQDVLSLYDSFVISSYIAQADARAKAFKVTGTPEMVVDGRYHISARLAGGHEEMLKVAQFLVDKIRAERAGKTGKVK